MGVGWDSDGSVREGKGWCTRTHSASPTWPPQVCSQPAPLAPSLTLNWRRRLAISYSRCSSMPRWRHHLREFLLRSDFTWVENQTPGGQGLASWGRMRGLTQHPDAPSTGPNTSPWKIKRLGLSEEGLLLLLPCLSATAPSYRKPSQTTLGQTWPLGSPSPLDCPSQPILGGHCLETGLPPCMGLCDPGGQGQVLVVTTGSPALPGTGPGPEHVLDRQVPP